MIHSILPFWAPYGRGKNHKRLPGHLWKTFLIPLSQVQPQHLPVFSVKLFHNFPGVFQLIWWYPCISFFWASCLFDKVLGFLKLLVYSSNLSCVGDYFTFHDFFNLPFHVSFDIFGFSWRSFSVRSIGDFIWFKMRDVKYRMNFRAWWNIEFECSVSYFSQNFE